MSFDEIMFWLIMAMSLTAVALLFWTLLGVIRTSRSGVFRSGLLTSQGAPFKSSIELGRTTPHGSKEPFR